MKVYLASRYEAASVMRTLAQHLEARGIGVTSRWIRGGHSLSDRKVASSDEERTLLRQFAYEDAEDINRADVLLLYNPLEYHGKGRGGRHWEVGYAYAMLKPIVLVGVAENVFHWLDGVTHLPSHSTIDQLVETLKGLHRVPQEPA